jgi:peptidoglycan hydrolase-like protein with peptidoglycan-binding domain
MDLRNKKLAVIEVQRMLQRVYESGFSIPYIIPDGVFGKQTQEAVYKYQQIAELPPTGIVNFITWEKLTSDYRKCLAQSAAPASITPFETLLKDGVLSPGEKCDSILILQIMLASLTDYQFEKPNLNGCYDEKTAAAVREIQRVSCLPECGITDKETWNVIAGEYNRAINTKENQ